MTFKEFVDLLNNNQGVLSLILFIGTVLVGWFTGIFRSLIKKPKFKIRVIPKMSFGSVYETGQTYTPPGFGTYDVHQTAFVIYPRVDKEDKVNLKIKVKDAFDRTFSKRVKVPIIDIEEANRYNEKFGQSHQLIDKDKRKNLEYGNEKYDQGDEKLDS